MNLFIATPMFGAQCAGIYTDAMCRLYDMCAGSDIRLQHRFVYNGSVIARLRTDLANEFMASDADCLLFVDADIGFDPRSVIDLVNIRSALDCEIIGAPYLKKHIRWDRVMQAAEHVAAPQELNDMTGEFTVGMLDGQPFKRGNAPIEVKHIGAGLMLIHRSAFDLFKSAYPERVFGQGAKVQYFADEIQHDLHVSEDVFFCNMVRNAGGKVICCPWMQVAHFGNHVYGGAPTEFVG